MGMLPLLCVVLTSLALSVLCTMLSLAVRHHRTLNFLLRDRLSGLSRLTGGFGQLCGTLLLLLLDIGGGSVAISTIVVLFGITSGVQLIKDGMRIIRMHS